MAYRARFLGIAVGASLSLGLGSVTLAQTAEDDELWDLLESEPSAEAPPSQPAENPQGTPPPAAPAEEPASPSAEAEPAASPEPQPATTADTVSRPRSSAIEEIVVTAQRREENLQDVPISITVLDQEQISNANITNSADLVSYTPSLQANTRFGPENAAFSIRGFTQDLRTTASVGVYFADVVAPRGQSSQTSGDGAGPGTLFDLQNIQVLKGPQGTLFGRNTTGGAILIVPQKPTDEFEGFAELVGGDLSTMRGQAVVNYPFSEDLRFRFSLDKNERDGNLTNVHPIGERDLGNVDYTAARLSAVWDITDTLENYSILSGVDSDTHGYTSQLYACNNPLNTIFGVVQDPSSIDLQQLIASLPILLSGGVDPTNLVPGVPLPSPFALLTFQDCEAQLANQAASGQNGFYDVVNTVKTAVTQIKEKRFINTTTWSINDNLTFKNILAYAHLETQNGSNIFGTYFPDDTDSSGRREFSPGASVVSPDVPVTSQETIVEEMQLQGSSFDERLIWQTGLYYEHSKPDGFSGNNAASFVYCDLGTIEGQPSGYDCFDPMLGFLGGVLRQQFKTEYLNKAVYAQGTWNIFESLSATLGLRYTKDETEGFGIKNLHRFALNVPQPVVTTTQSPKVESDAPTGMFEVSYRPYEQVMTYAKYTRGYRQGSVNLAADAGLDTHDPEQVDTYEIGLKSTFDFPFPGRFNVAIFDNELTDMQLQGGYISTTSGPTTAIFNAGKAESSGFEIEATVQPFEPLTASFSYAKLDTKLLESADFCGEVASVGFLESFTCTPIAVVGDQLPYAPEEAYVLNLNWLLPIPEEYGVVNLGATYAYTGEQQVAASTSTPFFILDDFGIVNLNVAWSQMFGRPLDLVVFGTNVTSEEYTTYTSGTFQVLGFESRAVGMPKIVGARLRYNF